MIAFCVRRPVATFMFYGAIILLGIIAVARLKVSLFPDIIFPRLTILTAYSNVTAEEIENLVTRPVEDAVSSVSGVKKIVSTSQEGLSIVEVSLDWGSRLDPAVIQMRQKIDLARAILPQDTERSLIVKFDPSQEPILTLIAHPAPKGSVTFQDLRDYVERTARPLFERIEGVASISILGGYRREITVSVDRYRLLSHNLSLDQIVRSLDAGNYSFPAGVVRRGRKEFNVRVRGEFQDTEQIRNTVVKTTDSGTPVYLHQMAIVTDGFRERRGTSLHDGEEAVIVQIKKEPGHNTVETAETFRSALAEINHRFRDTVQFEILHDESASIVEALRSVGVEAILGGGIAFLVLLIFLKDAQAAIIILLSIPVSIMGTFVLMYFSQTSLNIISLGGLALGTGVLVDHSIVVIESIYLVRERGMVDMKESAIHGTQVMAGSVLASSFTQAVVFLPIIFVSGIAGEIFRDLALTVTFSVINSFISSLTLIPVLASVRWTPLLPFMRSIDRHLEPIYEIAAAWLAFIHSIHSGCLRTFVKNPLPLILGTCVITAVGLLLFIPIERRLLPDVDSGIVEARIEFPEGSPLESVQEWMRRIHDDLRRSGRIRSVVSHIGMDEDDLDSRVKGIRKPWYTESTFFLEPSKSTSRDFLVTLQHYFSESRGIRKTFRVKGDVLQNVLGDDAAVFLMDVESANRQTARRIAESARADLEKMPGIMDLRASSRAMVPEIRLALDRTRLAASGLTVQDAAGAIRNAIHGQIATVYHEEDREIDIRVRLRPDDRTHPNDLPLVPVIQPDGKAVELAHILEPVTGLAHSSILRENQRRLERLEITTDSANQSTLLTAMAAIKNRLERDMHNRTESDRAEIRILHKNAETLESLSSLSFAFLLSGILIYQLLAGQFESLIHPFTLLLAIPLMFAGVSGSLLISNNSLNINSTIGLIMLTGIVVNNSIVLYASIRDNSDGLSLEARLKDLPVILEKSGRDRIRPILLSTLTTTLASIPMALKVAPGAEMQSSMSVVVIGGLLASTLLTLLAFPVFFYVVETRLIRRALRAGEPGDGGASR